MALLSLASYAQNVDRDRINLKTGKTIKCTISAIDSVSMNLLYSVMGVPDKVYIKEIASYTWNGKVNAGLPKRVNEVNAITNDQPFHNDVSAGPLLMKFASQAQTGIVIMIVGTAVTNSAWLLKADASDPDKHLRNQKTLVYAGLGITAAGLIVHLVSYSQARKAGELLKIKDNLAVGIGDNGLGLVLKL